jgi:hypothetical protein
MTYPATRGQLMARQTGSELHKLAVAMLNISQKLASIPEIPEIFGEERGQELAVGTMVAAQKIQAYEFQLRLKE